MRVEYARFSTHATAGPISSHNVYYVKLRAMGDSGLRGEPRPGCPSMQARIYAMDKEFWHQRWRSGQIGFHADEIHWGLKAYWPLLDLPSDAAVLVPLCGKSLDMHWLSARGHPVSGVELDPLAIEHFFDEWRREPSNISDGSQLGFESGGICLWQTDFLQFRSARYFDAFYDRAALIALPQTMRRDYMSKLRKCLADRSQGLLITLEYEQNQKSGPPFSVLHEELICYQGFDFDLLERRSVLAESPKFRDHGVDSLHEAVYRVSAA